jgi:predicted nucleotidyltransferase
MDACLLRRQLRQRLQAIYGERLRGIYLYGSYARGEQDAESDLDVLIVLDGVPHYSAEVDRTSRLISELSIEHGVSISRVFISERDWASGDTPFVTAARREAVPA